MKTKYLLIPAVLTGMLLLAGCTESAYSGASAATPPKTSAAQNLPAPEPQEKLGAGEIRFDEYNIHVKCYADEPCIKTYGGKTTDCTHEVNAATPDVPANGVNVLYSDIPNKTVLAVLCLWRNDPDFAAL